MTKMIEDAAQAEALMLAALTILDRNGHRESAAALQHAISILTDEPIADPTSGFAPTP